MKISMKKLVSITLLCIGFITNLTAHSYWKQIGTQGPSIVRLQDESQTKEIVLGYETRFFDEGSGLFYIVTGANTVEVSRIKTENLEPYSYEGDIIIPETVDFEGRTYTITGIGERAFNACQLLTSVVVPSTVTYIDYRAFYYCPSLQSVVLSDNIAEMGSEVFRYCEQLTSVNIPQAMTYLPDYLFGECSSLSAMEIPETITHIGDYAFANTALTSAVIPNSVKTIGNGAFSNCKDLEMVQLPDSLECINGYLFNGCEKLRSVNIPTTVRTIEACAFTNCIIEGDLTLHDGLVKIGGSAFESCHHITKATIPNTVTSIERCAFMDCSNLISVALPDRLDTIALALFSSCHSLSSISIPESVVSIGEDAFYRCDSLKQVSVSRHVSDIGNAAFAECCSLKSIDVDHDNAYYKSVNGVLFNASKTLLMQYPAGKEDESYQVPGSVTVLDRSSFAGAAHLQHVDVPNSVSVIGQHAFYRCSGLRSFVVPNNVTAIHPWTFAECLELQTVTMGSSVEIIDEDAFYRCQQLSLVVLGSSVRSIGQGAFSTYSALNPEEPAKLTLVCCRTTPVSYYEYATPYQEALIVPCGLESDYAAVWPYWNGDIIGDCNSYQIDVAGNIAGNQINLSTTSAKLGDEVQYSVALESGYMLESIEVFKYDNETIKIPVKDNKFVMPNFDVVVKAHFLPLSLEDPGAEWYYEILNENGSVTYQYLMQAGDTLVNGEEPYIIIRINTLYDKDEHIEKTHEYIFERNNVVYWWNKTLGEFTVLYDFGAKAGDEWEIKVGTTSLVMHVDAVEQYEYEDHVFKMLHVSDASDLFSGTIVSGIGHLTSFFPERLMNSSKDYRIEGIRCFWKDEQLLFKYGDKDCDEVYEEYHYDIDEPTTTHGFLIYPNPTDGMITVSGHQSVTYRITNVKGQTVMSGTIVGTTLNLSALPAGMYFITIGNKTQKLIVTCLAR